MAQYASYSALYEPHNGTFDNSSTPFNSNGQLMSSAQFDTFQEHKPFTGTDFNVGMKNVFENGKYDDEPVGRIFFSGENVKRLQQQIKKAVKDTTHGKYVLDEDQDTTDLLIAMRGTYMEHGEFRPTQIIHQVKELNKRLVAGIIPDMITEIKQYYDYLKDVNEPIKPIDRPMNVSNAGRRTLPSITTIWTR